MKQVWRGFVELMEDPNLVTAWSARLAFSLICANIGVLVGDFLRELAAFLHS